MPKKVPTHQVVPNRYEQGPERKADRAFYSAARWVKLSKTYRKRHPLCECGCLQPSQEVHHIFDRKDHPELAYEWSNLQALTKSCHSRMTREKQLKGKQ